MTEGISITSKEAFQIFREESGDIGKKHNRIHIDTVYENKAREKAIGELGACKDCQNLKILKIDQDGRNR